MAVCSAGGLCVEGPGLRRLADCQESAVLVALLGAGHRLAAQHTSGDPVACRLSVVRGLSLTFRKSRPAGSRWIAVDEPALLYPLRSRSSSISVVDVGGTQLQIPREKRLVHQGLSHSDMLLNRNVRRQSIVISRFSIHEGLPRSVAWQRPRTEDNGHIASDQNHAAFIIADILRRRVRQTQAEMREKRDPLTDHRLFHVAPQ